MTKEDENELILADLANMVYEGNKKILEGQRLTAFAQEGQILFLQNKLTHKIANIAIVNILHTDLTPHECWIEAILKK